MQLGPVLDTLKYLRHETNVWLEVTTLLISGGDDSDAELHRAAEWFAENLRPDVPWQFTAFHPDFKVLHKPPTPHATLTRSREIAPSEALRYVYTGNVRGAQGWQHMVSLLRRVAHRARLIRTGRMES